MKIKGKLDEIFDTVQVTETFKKREFIIEDNKNPEYPEYIKVELTKSQEIEGILSYKINEHEICKYIFLHIDVITFIIF